MGEVEQSKKDRKNYAHDLFVTFRRYERRIGGSQDSVGRLFMLDFDYIQPAIKPSDIGLSAPSLKQRLLYFSRDTKQFAAENE